MIKKYSLIFKEGQSHLHWMLACGFPINKTQDCAIAGSNAALLIFELHNAISVLNVFKINSALIF